MKPRGRSGLLKNIDLTKDIRYTKNVCCSFSLSEKDPKKTYMHFPKDGG
jgi:hypothetical protein